VYVARGKGELEIFLGKGLGVVHEEEGAGGGSGKSALDVKGKAWSAEKDISLLKRKEQKVFITRLSGGGGQGREETSQKRATGMGEILSRRKGRRIYCSRMSKRLVNVRERDSKRTKVSVRLSSQD